MKTKKSEQTRIMYLTVYIVAAKLHASESTCAETNETMRNGEIRNRSLQMRGLSLMFVAEPDQIVGFRDPLRAEHACLYLHETQPASWARLALAQTPPLMSTLRLCPQHFRSAYKDSRIPLLFYLSANRSNVLTEMQRQIQIAELRS